MTRLKINGKEILVADGTTLIQACEEAKIWVPRFCYHEKLSISGNCRMCLVEVEKAAKPLVAACAITVTDGLSILTDTPLVRKARESVLEFLFINHPLDCPICDQGGECDLQDQAVAFGSDHGRFTESKRAVLSGFGFNTTNVNLKKESQRDFGPLIQTQMTRCIHCTRCIRFARELAGTPESIGMSGRGRNSEVGMYVNLLAGEGLWQKVDGGALASLMASELSGNLVDICPVGALTSKPYAFQGRPWELKGTESIDVMDGLGSNIRIETKGHEVMRILPRSNEQINEEWISDTGRFSYDGLRRQRLIEPLYRPNLSTPFSKISWRESLKLLSQETKKSLPTFVVGDLIDVESLNMVKILANQLGTNQITMNKIHPSICNIDWRSDYLFNTSLDLDTFDAGLLINVHPKKDGAIWNLKLRKRLTNQKLPPFKVAQIGSSLHHFPSIQSLGSSMKTLVDIIEGKNRWLKVLLKSKNPLIIIGSEFLQNRTEAMELKPLLDSLQRRLAGSQTQMSVFAVNASFSGMCDVGLTGSTKNFSPSFYYLLGCDSPTILSEISNTSNSFLVYQGHHGDRGASIANLVLPSLAYTEKPATYVNTLGMVQSTQRALMGGPVQAKEDSQILRGWLEFHLNQTSIPSSAIDLLAPYLNTKISPVSFLVPKFPMLSTCVRLNLSQIQPRYEYNNVITRNSLVMTRASKQTSELTQTNSWSF